ncbi:methionyl-tRNA formyltransferase, mitochondrial isoform X2 [Dermacentor variabilis]|uniref:methionyl-tRNA formyltransferase, mitochondrial isoform X2 n=1 Tax=Dermacentor variabilis TaxID=34621 RepID=UPI003F5B852C
MTFARVIAIRSFSCSTERQLWKVVFYGSDSFSLKSLQLLNKNRLKKTETPQVIDSIKVVCPKLKGVVSDYALKEDLPVSEWPYSVPVDTFDVGVVVSFGHLIPASSIHACKYGMINVHPSLLPRWRGAAPLVHTLLAGDTESGISVITVAPKRYDTGKILAQKTVTVPQGIHLAEYTSMMAKLGANLLLQCLQDLPGLLSQAHEQGSDGVTKASKISPSMGAVHWAQHTEDYIDRLYRAVGNFTTLTTFWRGCKVKLFDMVPPTQLATAKLEELVKTRNVKPGHIYYHAKRKILCIKCKEGWVAFSAITIKGHKKMTATDFNCGFLSKVPEHEQLFSEENVTCEAAENT